jgi:hypothetical protein
MPALLRAHDSHRRNVVFDLLVKAQVWVHLNELGPLAGRLPAGIDFRGVGMLTKPIFTVAPRFRSYESQLGHGHFLSFSACKIEYET